MRPWAVAPYPVGLGSEQAFAAPLPNVGCPQQRPSVSVTGSVRIADKTAIRRALTLDVSRLSQSRCMTNAASPGEPEAQTQGHLTLQQVYTP
jgi:hypothetical protein